MGSRQQPFGVWPSSLEQFRCDLSRTWEDCPLGLGHVFCNDLGYKPLNFVVLNVGHRLLSEILGTLVMNKAYHMVSEARL